MAEPTDDWSHLLALPAPKGFQQPALREVQFPYTPFPLPPALALLGRRGSESHGLYVPSTDPTSIDDRDLMGICLPPASVYLGFTPWQGTEGIHGVWDVVLYEFRKFVGLLLKQNPNALSLLWLEPSDYLHVTPAGQALIDQRDLFRCRDLAYDAFVGYARSQIGKMRQGAFRGYMGAKRKELVARVGYDSKNAAHAIRLLHMGREFLETGRLAVRRTWDRDLLLEVKRGEWPLEDVQAYAAEAYAAMERARADSPLPVAVDYRAAEDLAITVLGRHLVETAPTARPAPP